jgi:HD-GYP domain-containing protein (c-di-GMP phosphodiesterase class II)/HAMP domain-containing protein
VKIGRMSLGRKFAVAFLCCALLPLLLAATLAYVRTSSGLRGIENRQLTDAASAMVSAVAQYETTLTAPYTAAPQFAAAVVSRDRTGLTDTLTGMLETPNMLQAQVLDSERRLLAQATVLESPAVIGDPAGGVAFRTYLGKLWAVTATPIHDPKQRGTSLGTLVVASQMDDAMLSEIAQHIGTPVNIYVGDQLAASSASGHERPKTQLAPAGTGVRGAARTTAYTQLRDENGQAVAVLAVSMPNAAFASTRSSVVSALELAVGLALVTSLLAALLLSHTVARPLRALNRAAQAISKGEMRQHIDVKGSDEVAVVGNAFNDMAERMAQTFEGLSDQIQVLSRGLADLSLVGESLAQATNVEAELSPVAARVRTMTRSDFCSVYLLDGANMLPGVCTGALGTSTRAVEELTHNAITTRQSQATVDLAGDERLSKAARHGAVEITSVMAMPIVHQGRAVGAVTVGSKELRQYSYRTAAILSTVASQVATALRHAETFKELERSYLQTITALAAALEVKDEYTAGHAESMAVMAVAVGEQMGLSEQQLRHLEYAALLHDVGKIGVPAAILGKPGALTNEEFAVITQHTVFGERIVSRIEYLRPLAGIIRAAHERWDGHGYPDGLAGEAIPLEARIILACDAFDAMTSNRPYRATKGKKEALDELVENSGRQFDPAVVTAFVAAYRARGAMLSAQAESEALAEHWPIAGAGAEQPVPCEHTDGFTYSDQPAVAFAALQLQSHVQP